MKTLPDKFSEFILLAKQDAKAILKTPGYVLDMAHWHNMRLDGTCHVCLAGAIIAQQFPDLRTFNLRPADVEDSETKLHAVDDFRALELLEAIALFYSYEKLFDLKNEIEQILSTSKNQIHLSGIVTSEQEIDDFYNQEAVTRFIQLLHHNNL